MFSLGFTEIAVVCLLAVILFPPRELPKLARSVARFYGTIRRTADDFKSAILEDPDLNEPIDEIKSAYRSTRWEVRRAEEAARRELAKARMDARMAVRGRVASGELDEDSDDDLDDDRPAIIERAPLAVATDPEENSGGDPVEGGANRSQAQPETRPVKLG